MTYWTEEQLDEWVAALDDGEVVAAPAEGVYGYCCDPFNEEALKKLNALKQRPNHKGFITLVNSYSEARGLSHGMGPADLETMENCWPGGTTLILPADDDLPDLLTGGRRSIAMRMPSKDYMQEYLEAWGGPLVSTSLNLSGQMPVTNERGIPPKLTKLTLPTPLSGKATKIFDPEGGRWLR